MLRMPARKPVQPACYPSAQRRLLVEKDLFPSWKVFPEFNWENYGKLMFLLSSLRFFPSGTPWLRNAGLDAWSRQDVQVLGGSLHLSGEPGDCSTSLARVGKCCWFYVFPRRTWAQKGTSLPTDLRRNPAGFNGDLGEWKAILHRYLTFTITIESYHIWQNG